MQIPSVESGKNLSAVKAAGPGSGFLSVLENAVAAATPESGKTSVVKTSAEAGGIPVISKPESKPGVAAGQAGDSVSKAEKDDAEEPTLVAVPMVVLSVPVILPAGSAPALQDLAAPAEAATQGAVPLGGNPGKAPAPNPAGANSELDRLTTNIPGSDTNDLGLAQESVLQSGVSHPAKTQTPDLTTASKPAEGRDHPALPELQNNQPESAFAASGRAKETASPTPALTPAAAAITAGEAWPAAWSAALENASGHQGGKRENAAKENTEPTLARPPASRAMAGEAKAVAGGPLGTARPAPENQPGEAMPKSAKDSAPKSENAQPVASATAVHSAPGDAPVPAASPSRTSELPSGAVEGMPAERTLAPSAGQILDAVPPLESVAAPVTASHWARAAQAEMNIDLHTSAFGNVEVHTSVRGNQVGILVSSERGGLQPLLSTELPIMEASLRRADLHLESVRMVETGNGDSAGMQMGSEQHPRDGRAQPGGRNQPQWPQPILGGPPLASEEPQLLATRPSWGRLSIHA